MQTAPTAEPSRGANTPSTVTAVTSPTKMSTSLTTNFFYLLARREVSQDCLYTLTKHTTVCTILPVANIRMSTFERTRTMRRYVNQLHNDASLRMPSGDVSSADISNKPIFFAFVGGGLRQPELRCDVTHVERHLHSTNSNMCSSSNGKVTMTGINPTVDTTRPAVRQASTVPVPSQFSHYWYSLIGSQQSIQQTHRLPS